MDRDSYKDKKEPAIVVCSLGDASVTEGEVAEAFQMAALKQFPILYLIQDNGWDISANAEETKSHECSRRYAEGFKGIETRSIEATFECYTVLDEVIKTIRKNGDKFWYTPKFLC
ncbi:MAG: thiamine pyrophosphate-dependent enzyme [Saprospiraceae bacterium]